MLRPGRLDKIIHVPIPQSDDRIQILQQLARKTPLGPDVDIRLIALDPRCEGFSGADMASLLREASLCAVKEHIASLSTPLSSLASMAKTTEANAVLTPSAAHMASPSSEGADSPGTVLVRAQHFNEALAKVFPSVSAATVARYERMERVLKRSRSALKETKESTIDSPKRQTV